jgi:hypothetical protein
MIDGRVVERPSGGHRFLKLKLGLINGLWLNWKPGGTLSWKVKTIDWKGQRVVSRKSASLRL